MNVRRVLAIAVAALALTACADEPVPSGNGATPSARPPGSADDVVLRLSYEGGFVPAGFPLLDLPAFTLYGDGTIITPGAQIEIYPGPALPAIVERRADEAAIRAIVDRAIAAGLGETDIELTDTGDVGIADASTSVFTLTVDGRTTTARVYALGFDGDAAALPGLSEEQRRIRKDLSALAADLSDLSWVQERGGALGDESFYVGDAARLLISPAREDPELPQDPITWPLDAKLRTLGDPVTWDDRTRCAVVAGDDWSVLRSAAERANQLTPWTDGATERFIAFRPLLPDESGC
ncbi:MAG TPA: hypothetical protein VLA82_10765 [Actinomycetota bacterium]|nr:hypothetical protein [Actinomycetota bacterium]